MLLTHTNKQLKTYQKKFITFQTLILAITMPVTTATTAVVSATCLWNGLLQLPKPTMGIIMLQVIVVVVFCLCFMLHVVSRRVMCSTDDYNLLALYTFAACMHATLWGHKENTHTHSTVYRHYKIWNHREKKYH